MVEKRVRKYLSWNDLLTMMENGLVLWLDLLVYAHDRFHLLDHERRGSQPDCDRTSQFCHLINKSKAINCIEPYRPL